MAESSEKIPSSFLTCQIDARDEAIARGEIQRALSQLFKCFDQGLMKFYFSVRTRRIFPTLSVLMGDS